MAIKQKLARKAVKSTAKHTAHGAVSKLRRKPPRAVTLLGLGVLAGVLLGWLLARSGGGSKATATDDATGSDEAVQPAAPGIPPTPIPAAAASVTGGPS
jgi:hypothetical protein